MRGSRFFQSRTCSTVPSVLPSSTTTISYSYFVSLNESVSKVSTLSIFPASLRVGTTMAKLFSDSPGIIQGLAFGGRASLGWQIETGGWVVSYATGTLWPNYGAGHGILSLFLSRSGV